MITSSQHPKGFIVSFESFGFIHVVSPGFGGLSSHFGGVMSLRDEENDADSVLPRKQRGRTKRIETGMTPAGSAAHSRH